MKNRNFRIRVLPPSDNESLGGLLKASEGGFDENYDLILRHQEVSMLSKIFSPEKLRLIQIIREKKPASIRELARILKRAQPNVQKDVRELVELSVVFLEETVKVGKRPGPLKLTCPWLELRITF